MFGHAIDDHILFGGAFCALYHPCNLQGILKLNCIYIAHLVPWSESHLGFPKWTGPFPRDGSRGVSLSPQQWCQWDGGMTVTAGTMVSGACFSDPIGSSIVWGPTSMGSASGNSVISPGRMFGRPVSRCRRFLDVLLSVCSAMSESVVDSHSHHSHVAETSLCFPLSFPSFRR